MSEGAYVHVRTDLANKAAVETFCAANPTHFKLGSLIVAADGDMLIVINGTTGDTKVFTVADPS